MIRTINFIIVMGFPGLVQIQVLASWNINILCNNFQLIVVFVSPPYFTLPVERFVVVLLLFHLSLPEIYHMSDLIDYLIFYCFFLLFECM